MIIKSVNAKAAFVSGRLDASFHCSPGVLAVNRIQALEDSGVSLRTIAGPDGLGTVDATSRTRRVYAAPGEESVPYLRPYDVFDYIPQPADLLSKNGSSNISALMPEAGTILQTCSGRNLGPLTYADAYLSRFAVSDDMLRLHIDDEGDRLYTLAFLRTPTGQALLTRSKTGNVIDHLSPRDLGAIRVPFLDGTVYTRTVADMRRAVDLRESARVRLAQLIHDFENSIPKPSRPSRLADGWTQQASALGARLDAAFHDPLVSLLRHSLTADGGVRVKTVAETFIPGRYKRYYVAPGYGKPIISGRQLLQEQPVNLRYISARSLDFNSYALEKGMIAFGAEGRAEDRIGHPVLIADDRTGWLANNHVMRVRPRSDVNPGWLYLCFASWQVQAQIKAAACGSVVDAVSPQDLDEVILPKVDHDRGDAAYECWEDLSQAGRMEADVINQLETEVLARAERAGAAVTAVVSSGAGAYDA